MVTNDMGCGLTIGPKHAFGIGICKLIVVFLNFPCTVAKLSLFFYWKFSLLFWLFFFKKKSPSVSEIYRKKDIDRYCLQPFDVKENYKVRTLNNFYLNFVKFVY